MVIDAQAERWLVVDSTGHCEGLTDAGCDELVAAAGLGAIGYSTLPPVGTPASDYNLGFQLAPVAAGQNAVTFDSGKSVLTFDASRSFCGPDRRDRHFWDGFYVLQQWSIM